MEEKNKEEIKVSKHKNLSIIIVLVLISILSITIGLMMNKKLKDERNYKEYKKEAEKIKATPTPSTQTNNELEYKVNRENGNYELLVAGKKVDLPGASEISVTNRIDDVILVRVNYIEPKREKYLIIDKNANIILEITGKGEDTNYLSNNVMHAKGNIIDVVGVTNNRIYVISYLAEDLRSLACNGYESESVKYEEEMTYTNGKFSELKVVSQETGKEYLESTKQKCNTISFDPNKIINPYDNFVVEYYKVEIGVDNSKEGMGLTATINSDKKSVIVTIDWTEYFKVESLIKDSPKEGTYNYKVTGFTKDIKDVYISGWGQAAGKETIFYVMDDGTVEYTPISKALSSKGTSESTDLTSYGMIPNVSGVAEIGYAGAGIEHGSSWGTVIGITQDGSFYDLGKILDEELKK